MNQLPKLNKKLIYRCVIVLSIVGISLAVLPIAYAQEKEKKLKEEKVTQAQTTKKDAFAISGVEKFPESYAGLKAFEKEKGFVEAPEPATDFEKIFGQIAELDQAPSESEPEFFREENVYQKDPWAEARQEEQKRIAMAHYESRRSGIMFFSQKNDKEKESEPKDRVLDMLEKNMQLAQNYLGSGQRTQNPMMIPVKDFDENVGKLKDSVPFALTEGTLIPALLLNEINTDLPGPILARVTQNIWDSKTGQSMLIPQNSKLIGEYKSRIGHGQSRAQIVWTRIIFPNQDSVSLGEMVGLDRKGTSGARGSVDNHYDKVGLGLLMTTAIGAGVRLTQGKYDPNTATIGQEFGNSLAQETMRLGNKVVDKMLAIQPTIKLHMGKRLNVFVEQDLFLRPYQG